MMKVSVLSLSLVGLFLVGCDSSSKRVAGRHCEAGWEPTYLNLPKPMASGKISKIEDKDLREQHEKAKKMNIIGVVNGDLQGLPEGEYELVEALVYVQDRYLNIGTGERQKLIEEKKLNEQDIHKTEGFKLAGKKVRSDRTQYVKTKKDFQTVVFCARNAGERIKSNNPAAFNTEIVAGLEVKAAPASDDGKNSKNKNKTEVQIITEPVYLGRVPTKDGSFKYDFKQTSNTQEKHAFNLDGYFKATGEASNTKYSVYRVKNKSKISNYHYEIHTESEFDNYILYRRSVLRLKPEKKK